MIVPLIAASYLGLIYILLVLAERSTRKTLSTPSNPISQNPISQEN